MAKNNVAQVSEIIASEYYVICPHCEERVNGFCTDPRTLLEPVQCDSCHEPFTIHPDADVEIYN